MPTQQWKYIGVLSKSGKGWNFRWKQCPEYLDKQIQDFGSWEEEKERNERGKLLKADRLSSDSEGNYCTKEDLGSICKNLVESLFLSCFKAVFYLCFYVCTWVSLCVAHLLKKASGDQTPWNCKLPSTRLWPDNWTQVCY